MEIRYICLPRMVELGTSHGIRPGDFFGPVSAAHCLKEAVQVATEANQIPEMLRVYISQDAISKNSSRRFVRIQCHTF